MTIAEFNMYDIYSKTTKHKGVEHKDLSDWFLLTSHLTFLCLNKACTSVPLEKLFVRFFLFFFNIHSF